MIPRPALPRIECPIDLFEVREQEIDRLTAAVNHASAPEEKGRLARELMENVSILLGCSAYDRNNPSCRLCRGFSTLRQKTAAMIDQAAALRR